MHTTWHRGLCHKVLLTLLNYYKNIINRQITFFSFSLLPSYRWSAISRLMWNMIVQNKLKGKKMKHPTHTYLSLSPINNLQTTL